MMVRILSLIAKFIRKPQTAVSAVFFCVILGLCAWLWVQGQKIDSLKAENQMQAQTIVRQINQINQLQAQAEENARLTLELSQQENQSRRKADVVIKSISSKEKAVDAYRERAPQSVVEFLRQE